VRLSSIFVPVAVLIAPVLVSAQVVRGVVLDPAGAGLGYSVVSLVGTNRQILTDDAGRFVFAALQPGRYQLRARHLGFSPLDTTITLAANASVDLELRLDHLTIRLSEMHVVAPGPCVHPGVPDETRDYSLAAVFGQLRENADRAIVLGDQFPFLYRMERRITEKSVNVSEHPIARDTIAFDGNARWIYHPGNMITPVNDHGRMTTQLNIPGLVQFADSNFHAAHCFSYGGVRKVAGSKYIRVDFEPDIHLDTPDIEGSVFLDPESYQVRRLVMAVTQPDLVAPGITALKVTSTFRELMPSIVILDTAEGVTTVERATGGPVVRTERQKNVGVVFSRGAPPGTLP
jgi:hypothetical protein